MSAHRRLHKIPRSQMCHQTRGFGLVLNANPFILVHVHTPMPIFSQVIFLEMGSWRNESTL